MIPSTLSDAEKSLAQLIDPPEEQTLRVSVPLLIHRVDPDSEEVRSIVDLLVRHKRANRDD